MFTPFDGGSLELIDGIPCQIPPVGYVWNLVDNKLIKSTILFKNKSKSLQYWQREGYAKWYLAKRAVEEKRQLEDPEYIDQDCDRFREDQFNKRLYGVWFFNNGVPTYLTGQNWFYLEWWWIGDTYPNYRDSDRKYHYVWQYAIEHPKCYGLIELTRRQVGKGFRAGCGMFEFCSRTFNANGGIQSKNEKDAQINVFNKSIKRPFLKLPHYFKPNYDSSTGLTKSISFTSLIVRGKNHHLSFVDSELESVIDFRDSGEFAYDGATLKRYIGDEVGKSLLVDVYSRFEVIKPFLCPNGPITGKAIFTTTVEDMKAKNDSFLRMWKDSDPQEVDLAGGEMTTSGLIRLFTSSAENTGCDKYGFSDIGKQTTYYLTERMKKKHDINIYNGYVRKYPLKWEEAFTSANTTCPFNQNMLNEMLQNIRFTGYPFMWRGDLVWDERDKRVYKQDNPLGRITASYTFEDNDKVLNTSNRNGFLIPQNNHLMVMGNDPFDHYSDKKYNKYSFGSSMLKMRYSVVNEKRHFNDAFFLHYFARPELPNDFFEDQIMICFYFGVAMLFEDQVDGIRRYFDDRGYSRFLMWMPGEGKPGLSASPNVKISMVNFMTNHLSKCPDKQFFAKLIEDAQDFDITNTGKFDTFMSAGYALIAEDATTPRMAESQGSAKLSRGIEHSLLLRN